LHNDKKTIDARVLEYDDSHERNSTNKRGRWFHKKMQDTLQYAYKNAPAIKNKFDKAGVSLLWLGYDCMINVASTTESCLK
jgi:phenylacetate-coenzyme A ligase PaaK-like adenylate-forming protein